MITFDSPEFHGVPSSALLNFINALDKLEFLHGITIFRHGEAILQASWKPYSPDIPHHLFSLSKSFVSCAIGFALQDGRLSFTDTLGALFPEYATLPTVSEETKSITVKDLLTMRSGQGECHLGQFIVFPSKEGKTFAQQYMEVPLKWKPGEMFNYNSGNTYMLSAIIQKLYGMNVVEFLYPRLFEPLGIEKPYWQQSPEGVKYGGWGLFLTLEDISKFTKLISEGGVWEGKQILPADYLKEATSFHSDNSFNNNRDWENGYGYQFWRCSHEGAFRGDGACGQYALVIPDYDMAIATQAGLPMMGKILIEIWDNLLPSIKTDKPIIPVPADQQALAEKLASLELPKPQGGFRAGVQNGKFLLEKNTIGFDSVECQFQAAGGELILTRGEKSFTLPFGYGKWLCGDAPQIYNDLGGKVALAGAWENESTLLLNMAFLNEPTFAKYRLEFNGDSITINRNFHLWFLHGGSGLTETVKGKKA